MIQTTTQQTNNGSSPRQSRLCIDVSRRGSGCFFSQSNQIKSMETFRTRLFPNIGAVVNVQDADYKRHGIGASDIPAIMGICPYRTAEDVLNEKTGAKTVIENEAMRIGKHFELPFLEYLRRYHFMDKRSELLHNQYSYSRDEFRHYCTPDAVLINALEERTIFELKVSAYFSRAKFYAAEMQVQYTMHILDVESAKICVLQGTKVDIVAVPRNRAEGERLHDAATEFLETRLNNAQI